MRSNAILHEAEQLKSVCQRLESVAEHYPPVTDAVLTVCGTLRSTATLLEVLVATKLNGSLPI